jgi:hypothetical protein
MFRVDSNGNITNRAVLVLSGDADYTVDNARVGTIISIGATAAGRNIVLNTTQMLEGRVIEIITRNNGGNITLSTQGAEQFMDGNGAMQDTISIADNYYVKIVAAGSQWYILTKHAVVA